jgi:hypothetical protein
MVHRRGKRTRNTTMCHGWARLVVPLSYTLTLSLSHCALETDDRHRRIFVGDNSGSLCVVNMANGNVLRELAGHTTEIGQLLLMGRGLVISASIDGVVHVQVSETGRLGWVIGYE